MFLDRDWKAMERANRLLVFREVVIEVLSTFQSSGGKQFGTAVHESTCQAGALEEGLRYLSGSEFTRGELREELFGCLLSDRDCLLREQFSWDCRDV